MTSGNDQDASIDQPIPSDSSADDASLRIKAARELFNQQLRQASIEGAAYVIIPPELLNEEDGEGGEDVG